MQIVKLHTTQTIFNVVGKNNLLVGQISEQRDGRWKIELYMKWTHQESTEAQALAWVRGVMAVIEQD